MEEYCSVRCDLSRMIVTAPSRLWASRRVFAIGADVKGGGLHQNLSLRPIQERYKQGYAVFLPGRVADFGGWALRAASDEQNSSLPRCSGVPLAPLTVLSGPPVVQDRPHGSEHPGHHDQKGPERRADSRLWGDREATFAPKN